jgi:hypothetical protein
MCNLSELADGIMTDISIEKNARGIPSGMTIRYLKKATSDLYTIADGRVLDWSKRGEFIVPVNIFVSSNHKVFSTQITMNVTDKLKQ